MAAGSNTSHEHKSKIALFNGSQLLREMLIRVFHKLPDFEIVGAVRDLGGLELLLLSNEVDWLVISSMQSGGVSDEIKSVQARFPKMRILAIAADGSEVLINWLEPRLIHMEKATLPELIAAMRTATNTSQADR